MPKQIDNAVNITVYDGKYTVIQDVKGRLRALRYGDEWRDCCGDGLILALAQEVQNLRDLIVKTVVCLKHASFEDDDSMTIECAIGILDDKENK